jgi:hypothetical protein
VRTEYVASIFRVKKYAKQETSMEDVASKFSAVSYLLYISFLLELNVKSYILGRVSKIFSQ